MASVALIEHLIEGICEDNGTLLPQMRWETNFLLRHLPNAKPLSMVWWRFAFNEVNDCTLDH